MVIHLVKTNVAPNDCLTIVLEYQQHSQYAETVIILIIYKKSMCAYLHAWKTVLLKSN